MNTIEKIKARLQEYPHVRYESEPNSISVFPTSDDGFAVSLSVNPDSFTVSFNGWHEDFQSEEEALNCFGFGLSYDCRLKEYRCGKFAYKPNGRITVLDMVRAADAAEHDALVEQWARAVWAAWAPHHPTIQGYVARYLGW